VNFYHIKLKIHLQPLLTYSVYRQPHRYLLFAAIPAVVGMPAVAGVPYNVVGVFAVAGFPCIPAFACVLAFAGDSVAVDMSRLFLVILLLLAFSSIAGI
jgi:hypothetical protein